MAHSADVRSVEALDQLRGALKACGGEVAQALGTAQQGIREAQEWIQERITYWTTQVRYREEALEEAERALSACLASGDDEHAPNCSAEESALYAARQRLREAGDALTMAFRWRKEIEQAAIAYEQEAQRLSQAMEKSAGSGSALLDKSASDLHSYISRRSGLGSLAAAIGGVALAGAAGAVIGSSRGGSTESTTRTPGAPGGPPGSVRIGARSLGTMSLSEMNRSQLGVQGPSDFQKVPYSTVVSGLHRLRETVIPAVNQGLGADYFKTLDAEKGLNGADSYFAVYDAYYSESSGIKVDWTSSGWDIVNGHHRIAAAIWEGFTDLPAFVRGER
jgi:hypothetical protein